MQKGWGIVADNVREATLVTGAGDFVKAKNPKYFPVLTDSERDSFFAIFGSLGHVAVIIDVTFQIHPPKIVQWQQCIVADPNELYEEVEFMATREGLDGGQVRMTQYRFFAKELAALNAYLLGGGMDLAVIGSKVAAVSQASGVHPQLVMNLFSLCQKTDELEISGTYSC